MSASASSQPQAKKESESEEGTKREKKETEILMTSSTHNIATFAAPQRAKKEKQERESEEGTKSEKKVKRESESDPDDTWACPLCGYVNVKSGHCAMQSKGCPAINPHVRPVSLAELEWSYACLCAGLPLPLL